MKFPQRIEDVDHLEDLLSEPAEETIEAIRRLDGDVMLLGVGGKMGPTLARMVRRATDAAGIKRRVIGVARFSSPDVAEQLESQGVETIRCDLLDREQLEKLPAAPNVIYLAARKFGSTGQEYLTWAMNCLLPGLVFEKFRRSRIVAFSTGNVYPLVPVDRGGSEETDSPGPIGEYAMSGLGRERMYEFMSRTHNIPVAILRLYYAHELRYGVMVDIARQVYSGQPVDVTMGYFNALWQGDANNMTLRSFEHASSPPWVVNLVGPERLSVRKLARECSDRMGKSAELQGSEAADALLGNANRCRQYFGPPEVTTDPMLTWIIDWVERGGKTLGKPTHFEVRDGKF